MEMSGDLTRRAVMKTGITVVGLAAVGQFVEPALMVPAAQAMSPDPMHAVRNFDYAILLCSKMAETRAFYRDTMKFQIELDLENWVSFRVGSGLLTLRPRGEWIAWEDGPASPGSAAVQLAFRVPPQAVDTCYAELVAKGVPIVRAPTDLREWRHRTLFFRDPEENIVEIYAEI